MHLTLAFLLSTLIYVNAAGSSSVALDMHAAQISRAQTLRRCSSLSSDLSKATQSTSLGDVIELAESTPLAYSPAHSKRSYSNQRLRSSLVQRLKFCEENREFTVTEAIYTRLQTQLYPDMEF